MPPEIGLSLFKIFAPTLVASRSGDEKTGTLRIEGVASSSIKDHHGDQLTLRALKKMEQSAIGMTIFMNHDYKVPKDVFGKVEKAQVVRSSAVDKDTGEPIYDLRVGIAVARSNEDARKTFELIEKGEARLGISIGAMVPDGGATFVKEHGGRLVIDDVDVVEASVIGVPANPRSFVDYAMKSIMGGFAGDKKVEAKRASWLADELDLEKTNLDDQETIERVLNAQTITGEGQGQEIAGEDETVSDTPTDEMAPADTVEGTDTADERPADTVEAEGSGEGPGEAGESIDLEKTRVSVWEDDDHKVIEVDTGRARPKANGGLSAQDDDPDTAGGDPGMGAQKSLSLTVGVDGLEPVLAAMGLAGTQLKSSTDIVRALHGQLIAARDENERLLMERDAAIAVATRSLEGTREIINQLGETPMGRKIGFEVAQKDLSTLETFYSADVLKMMKG